jgi:hypothetical protein
LIYGSVPALSLDAHGVNMMAMWQLGLVLLGAVAVGIGGPILCIASGIVARSGSSRPWMAPSVLLVVFAGVTLALVGVTKLVTGHGVLLTLLAMVGGSVLALAASHVGRQVRDAVPLESLAMSDITPFRRCS